MARMRIMKLTKDTRSEALEALLGRSPSGYSEYEQTVREIIDDVRARGDQAVFALEEKFDHCVLTKDTIRVSREEIEEAYERNTGLLIVSEFARLGLDPAAVPGCLCKNHGPFAWGKDPMEAVHNAVVMEECAKMALGVCALKGSCSEPIQQELLDIHYLRKHGKN
ncbi:MAG: histidinol dehydrogenase, partial [Lachnospiraceae bacterium]|nr:histidinol dehydrogenase [Lachnospiraceae bacterium]